MSKGSVQQPTSGSASPAPSSSAAGAPTPKQSSSSKHQKASNVFSNDGSFLERFQRLKKDEEDKKKQEEILQCKRNFDNRFKTRGKRPPPPESDTTSIAKTPSTTESSPPTTKKPRHEKDHTADRSTSVPQPAISQYKKEMKVYAHNSLKDNGIGVRPLVK